MSELNFDSLTCSLDGAHLIEAAAGTGKTYNIQNLIVRLLLEKKMEIEEIAVVTFTEAAADELRTRLRDVITETRSAAGGKSSNARACSLYERALTCGLAPEEIIHRLNNADLDFDKAAVGTIHSFCRSLLKDFAFESGEAFELELLADSGKIRDSFVLDARRRLCYHGEYAALYSENINGDELAEKTRIKDAHPEVIFVPQAPDETLEQISRKFLDTWKSLQQSPLTCSVLEDIQGQLTKDARETVSSFLQSLQSSAPPAGDLKKCQSLEPEALKNAALKKCRDTVAAVVDSNPELFSNISSLLNTHKKLLALLRDTVVEDALKHYNDFKLRLNKITFDDILRRAGTALDNPAFIEAVRKRFQAGIIDEFQDTDPVQWKIFETIFGTSDKTLFLVGDPRQAIYSFRGGDINTYLSARKTIPPENRHTLKVNYRSCPELLKQVNRWFGEHACGFATPEITLPEITPPANAVRSLLIDGNETGTPLTVVDSGTDLNDTVNDIIVDLLTTDKRIPLKDSGDSRRVRPDDIAVLVRRWNEGFEIKRRLSQSNIPAVVQNGGNLFGTEMTEHLQRLLTGILNITDASAVRQALVTEICGLTFNALAQEKSAVTEKTALLAELKTLWQQKSFYAMFKKLLLEFDVEKRLASSQEKVRNLIDLIQLGDYLHQESSKRNLAPQALLDHLIYCRTHLDNSDQYPQEQEADSGAVTICTTFKSKGLQYPIVIVPCLNKQSKTPPETYTTEKKLYSGDDNGSGIRRAWDEQIQEELRVAYVALTRAENACIVVATPVSSHHKLTPLNWLWSVRNQKLTDSPSELLKNNCKNRMLPADLCKNAPVSGNVYTPPPAEGELNARKLENPLEFPLMTTSFSGMAPGHGSVQFTPSDPSEKEDDENDVPGKDDESLKSGFETDPFRRLRGKNFGLLLHGIMENTDFNASRETIRQMVTQEIHLSDPTGEEIDYATDVLCNTLSLQLPGGPVVSEIAPGSRCAEMKFHFAFDNDFSKGELRKIAAAHLKAEHEKRGDDNLKCHGGFITGSIDLLFEHDGKFYILDWKSNLLPDYSQETIRQSIINSYYQMQYLIYLAAVMRFLKQRLRLPQFGEDEYEKYIGGVYYVYMRGIQPDVPSSGVFFDRPSFAEAIKTADLLK